MKRFLYRVLHYPWLGKARYVLFYHFRFRKRGKKCYVRPAIIITPKFIELGDRVYIGDNCRIEGISRYAGETFNPQIIIGNDVHINQNLHCTCGGRIEIGDGTSITANCGIFDITHPYENINESPIKAKLRINEIKIGRDCFIGMNSVILPGTVLGDHCVVGCNTTVSGVFPDYSVIAGSPGKIVKQYSLEEQKWLKVNICKFTPPPPINII